MTGPNLVQQVDVLRQSVEAYLDSSRELEPTPSFAYSVGWFENYESLFQGEASTTTGIEAISDLAISTGRVLISGKGGGAKTVVIRRLMRQCLKEKTVPAVLDLKKWTSLQYQEWKTLVGSVVRMDYLLANLGPKQFSVMQLDSLPLNIKRLIFVDGLNEVTQGFGQEIIETIDEYAQLAVLTGIVVADRMARRTFIDEKRWRIASIAPLTADEIRQQLTHKFGDTALFDAADADTRALLSSPYFLNSLLRDGTPTAHTSSGTIHNYFVQHVSLSEPEIDVAGGAAYFAYKSFRSRSFPIDDFRKAVGNKVTNKLIDAKALLIAGTLASFDHHLKHDFLASRHAVKVGDWSPEVLGVLTFDASSFDALFMSLQQMTSSDDADDLIKNIYNWNPYGAAYALTDGGSQGRTLVSSEMQIVIITMLAERQWDLMKATQTKAKDALRLFPKTEVQRFLHASRLEELFPIVNSVSIKQRWFHEWKRLFTQKGKVAARDADVKQILNEDSLLGWTAANVLKRLPVPERSQVLLRKLIRKQDKTVRWRIVHVLGSFPTKKNLSLLFDRLDRDGYHWVRYGATRSLVEMAALGSDQIRQQIFAGIAKRAKALSRDEKSLREFGSAILIEQKRAPKNWVARLAPVIETFYNVESSFEKREQWRQMAFRLKGEYESRI
jgi:hypothetical protein